MNDKAIIPSEPGRFIRSFNGYDVEFLEKDGERWLTAETVGNALGYAEPRIAIQKILQRRHDEFDGLTCVVKMVTQIDDQSRDYTLISRDGVNLICMFSDQPMAKQFRRWVLGVIKEVQVTGRYDVQAPTDPKLLKEIEKEKRLSDRLKVSAIRMFMNAPGMLEKAKTALAAEAYAITTGNNPVKYLPVAPEMEWLTCTDMAKMLGVSPNAVGRKLKQIGLHGTQDADHEWSEPTRDKSKYSVHECVTYRYQPWVLDKLRQQRFE